MLVTAFAAFAAGLFCSDGNVVRNGILSEVEARVGRSLTPMSYAGVARRTTRRAVATGAAGGTAGAYSCVRVVDAYGRVTTRC